MNKLREQINEVLLVWTEFAKICGQQNINFDPTLSVGEISEAIIVAAKNEFKKIWEEEEDFEDAIFQF